MGVREWEVPTDMSGSCPKPEKLNASTCFPLVGASKQ